MNFHELMAKAAENQEIKKVQTQTTKRYDTSIPPPKKEVRKKKISPNVQAFLAKKEDEARKKVIEQRKFREKYLEKSKKCYRKVQNIHELIKEDSEKVDDEPVHVDPSSNKTAEDANSSYSNPVTPSKSSSKSGSSQKADAKTEREDSAKKKKKGNAPTFAELMKMAAEGKKNADVKKNDNVRPMTAKEKEELERQSKHKKSKEYRIWAEYGPAALERYKAQQRLKEGKTGSDSENDSSASKPGGTKRDSTGSPANASTVTKPQSKIPNSKPNGNRPNPGTQKPNGIQNAKPNGIQNAKPNGIQKARSKSDVKIESRPEYASTNENVLVCRPAPEQSPWDRLYGSKRPAQNERFKVEAESESEESEYDSEDGFIDDGPLQDPYANTISAEIRNIFGYDRRKFRDFDDDDRNMETSFREQMKEEARSARLGLKEDLEDIRREEEEMKAKMAAKKRRR